MTEYIISFSVDGLHDVIPQKGDNLQVGKAQFHYREDERVASVSLISKSEKEAEISALQEIDKSIGKICFGYNTEALIKKNGLYLVDVTNQPKNEKVVGSLTIRYGYVAQDPKDTLKQIESINNSKKGMLDLAIAYYRLGYAGNPLRLECFFSCLNSSDKRYLWRSTCLY